ncbi:MAG TPA: HPP family protein [Porticoccaceae bacterium]|nr:HPP family protein [Porticoccaceae bacterium]HCO61085.1 HPP family protein [Porticoccaceae bacterium]
MAALLKRHQPSQSLATNLLAGIGGFLAIFVLYHLTQWSGYLLWMAPFGASCVLLFALPQSPLSQPINVIGGHLVSTAIGLVVRYYLPDAGWSMALGVGLAIGAMAILRITHPPAGADPLVVYVESPDWSYLVFPVGLGSAVLVALAYNYHRVLTGRPYPLQ